MISNNLCNDKEKNDMKKESSKRNLKWKEKLQNFQNKFSMAQVHIITLILEIVWLMFVKKANNEMLNQFAIIGMLIIAVLVEMFIFGLDRRKSEEDHKQILSKVIEKFHFKQNELVEVWITGNNKQNEGFNYALQTLSELNIKLYAQLEEDKITLIKKDKNKETIGIPYEISNLVYFYDNFELKGE